VANTLNLFRTGAVGFFDWLDFVMMLLWLARQDAIDRGLDSWLRSYHPPDPNKCERYHGWELGSVRWEVQCGKWHACIGHIQQLPLLILATEMSRTLPKAGAPATRKVLHA